MRRIKVGRVSGFGLWVVYELHTSHRGTHKRNMQFFPTWADAMTEALDRADKALLHGIMQGGWI